MPSTWHSRGYLPHFDQPGVHQSITFRLADSLPHEILERLLRQAGDDAEKRRLIESRLDEGSGSCLLRRAACAEAMENILLLGDGPDYRLCAWAVMPNHVHVLIMTTDVPLAAILKEWKGTSARLINQLSGRQGTLWQREYWDRYIRDERHYQRTVAYMEENPVAARLVGRAEEYRWSSAWRRGENRNGPSRSDGGPAD
jgi:putative transposase